MCYSVFCPKYRRISSLSVVVWLNNAVAVCLGCGLELTAFLGVVGDKNLQGFARVLREMTAEFRELTGMAYLCDTPLRRPCIGKSINQLK